ncbi:MAG: hypothetical protein Q9173_005783 [Seirophora scorigena]
MTRIHFKLLGLGSIGIVYQVTDTVAVKCLRSADSAPFEDECRVYDLLEKHSVCPNIVRSFYRTPSVIFLQLMTGGTLDGRLRQYQSRNLSGLVESVKYAQPDHMVWQWIAELTDAVAWLEYLGLVHGDLRPSNLLLDDGGHLKIADFDNAAAIGDVSNGIEPPYARLLGVEGAHDRGTFGYHGPRTEQFAIGSIVYYMSRGFEPYDDQWLGEDRAGEILDRLQAMNFPATSDSEVDKLIRGCWYGDYTTMQCLNVEVMRLCPVYRDPSEGISAVEVEAVRQECKQLVAEGVLDIAGYARTRAG